MAKSNYFVNGHLSQSNDAAPSMTVVSISNTDRPTFQRIEAGVYSISSEDLKKGSAFIQVGAINAGFVCKSQLDRSKGTFLLKTYNLAGELADNLLSETEIEILHIF